MYSGHQRRTKMSIKQQLNRQLEVAELVERLNQLGVDWSEVTGTDSADPTSAEPPTAQEIELVREYLANNVL